MTDWENFEQKVQDTLGLEPTITSGNKWYDISDGVHRDQNPYRVMVDAKFTEASSYTLQAKFLQEWHQEAAKLGYKFALPIKLSGSRATPNEWVAIPLDDYAELVETIRRLSANRSEQIKDLKLVANHIIEDPLTVTREQRLDLLKAVKNLTGVLDVSL